MNHLPSTQRSTTRSDVAVDTPGVDGIGHADEVRREPVRRARMIAVRVRR